MKKIFLTFATAAVVALVAVPAMAALDFPTVAGLAPGSLIKSADSSTVYYFGEDEMRYGFPDENTFFTWYEGFDSVQTIALSEMNMIPFGGMTTYKPQFGNDGASTRLLKLATSSTVYVPIGDGMLIAIKGEDQATALFGEGWNALVDDLPDAFVPNYLILGGNLGEDTSFVEDEGYTISDDKELSTAAGLMMYEEPLRFAAEDETVELGDSNCADDYCGYNVVTVEQGDTLKFVNYTSETLTIREDVDNLFSTGKIDPEAIAVITIDLEPGTYNFRADEDWEMMGVLVVE